MSRRRIPEVGVMLRFYDHSFIYWREIDKEVWLLQGTRRAPVEGYILGFYPDHIDFEDPEGKRFRVYRRAIDWRYVYVAVEPGVGVIRKEKAVR